MRCDRCMFWGGAAEIFTDGPLKGESKGECWFNPPQLILMPAGQRQGITLNGPQTQMGMQLMSISPTTVSFRCCHEFTLKPLAEQQKKEIAA